MSFKYETQYNSPNYTPASQAVATWGRPRTIEAIAIHWWGDPNQGPTYEGVIATLCNPNRGASAHFVATGTGRRVACLVDLGNASWATNSANPYTISIECDPRCREEDYDVVAELIANIRSAYGNLPLVPHKQFVATACPGNYNLAELDRRAKLKDGSGDWGVVKNKEEDMIPDQDNFYWRYGQKTALAIRGRELSRDEFRKYLVGQSGTRAIEILSDDPEADKAQNWQNVGKQAVAENWKGTIETVTKDRDAKATQVGELTDTVAKKNTEIEELKQKLAAQGSESPSNGSGGSNGSDTPSGSESGSQTFWEWLQEILSKFKRSK